jgi:putative phosphoesterase
MFDAPMLIGVISDTHGLLRPEALEAHAGVDHIIHAGDIGSPEIVPRLQEIAPVTAIRGNVDEQSWAAAFSERTTVVLAGRSIHVLHDLGELDLDPVAAGFDMVVSGHSHRPKTENVDGVVYLNPGSAGPRRFRLPITVAIVDLTAKVIDRSCTSSSARCAPSKPFRKTSAVWIGPGSRQVCSRARSRRGALQSQASAAEGKPDGEVPAVFD